MVTLVFNLSTNSHITTFAQEKELALKVNTIAPAKEEELTLKVNTKQLSKEKQPTDKVDTTLTPKEEPVYKADDKKAEQQDQTLPRIGIDVSYHNLDIDWQAVKDSGIQFAIIRTSYGWELWDKQTDRKLRDNINGAKSVGMPIGAYHYSYATTQEEALKEADFFITRLRWTQWEYPVFFDFEDRCQKSLSPEQKSDIIVTFINRLRQAGYYAGYYTFLNRQRYELDMSKLQGQNLWVAHWSPTCDCQVPYGMWQYTSDGSVNGINGRVDMNYCYVDYPTIIKNNHLNGF